jgi:stage III sporulation protein AF
VKLLESLQTLIVNLAVILLLATFLEMLLPNKSLKGFVKLVMGLFVISAILSPITSLLRMTVEGGVPAWLENTAQEMPVLASQEEGESIGTNAVQDQYKSIIINQVKALIGTIQGVKDLQVNVDLEEGAGGLTNIPKINRILIQLDTGQGVTPIEEVVINLEQPREEQPASPLALEVRDKIAAFMQMPIDQVIVTER